MQHFFPVYRHRYKKALYNKTRAGKSIKSLMAGFAADWLQWLKLQSSNHKNNYRKK